MGNMHEPKPHPYSSLNEVSVPQGWYDSTPMECFASELNYTPDGPAFLMVDGAAFRQALAIAAAHTNNQAPLDDPANLNKAVEGLRGFGNHILDATRRRTLPEHEAFTKPISDSYGYWINAQDIFRTTFDYFINQGDLQTAQVIHKALWETLAQCSRITMTTTASILNNTWLNGSIDAASRATGQSLFDAAVDGAARTNPKRRLTIQDLVAVTQNVAQVFTDRLDGLAVDRNSLNNLRDLTALLCTHADVAEIFAMNEQCFLERTPQGQEADDPISALRTDQAVLLTQYESWKTATQMTPLFRQLAPELSKKQINALQLHELETRLRKSEGNIARQLAGMLYGLSTCELDDETHQACAELFALDAAFEGRFTTIQAALRAQGAEPIDAPQWLGSCTRILRDPKAWQRISPLIQQYWPNGGGHDLAAKVELFMAEPSTVGS